MYIKQSKSKGYCFYVAEKKVITCQIWSKIIFKRSRVTYLTKLITTSIPDYWYL